MRARDGDQHGVPHLWLEAAEPMPDESRHASRLGLLDDALQLRGAVVLVYEEQAVEPGASGVEQVARAPGRKRGVRDERDPGESELELPNLLEVCLSVREQVEYGKMHRLFLARPGYLVPALARQHGMLPVERVHHSLQAAVIGEQGGDDTHGVVVYITDK